MSNWWDLPDRKDVDEGAWWEAVDEVFRVLEMVGKEEVVEIPPDHPLFLRRTVTPRFNLDSWYEPDLDVLVVRRAGDGAEWRLGREMLMGHLKLPEELLATFIEKPNGDTP